MKQNKQTKIKESSLCLLTTLEYGACPGVLDIPSITKENWLSFPSSNQMSIAPQLGRDFLPTSTLDAELLSDVSSTCCHVTMSSHVSALLCLENVFLLSTTSSGSSHSFQSLFPWERERCDTGIPLRKAPFRADHSQISYVLLIDQLWCSGCKGITKTIWMFCFFPRQVMAIF